MTRPRKREDGVQTARRVADRVIILSGDVPDERPKRTILAPLVASEMGRRGGPKGGRARANALTPERRVQIARDAARKRWSKKPN